jgi:hypothetical protein
VYSDGSKYEGEMFEGKRHGFGTFYCNKTVYTGQWDYNRFILVISLDLLILND